MGFTLTYEYRDLNRTGDHLCYISDLTKLRSHFPEWRLEYDVSRILTEIVNRHVLGLQSLLRATADV